MLVNKEKFKFDLLNTLKYTNAGSVQTYLADGVTVVDILVVCDNVTFSAYVTESEFCLYDISVESRVQRQGLATDMVKKFTALAHKKGLNFKVSAILSPYMMKIVEQEGFSISGFDAFKLFKPKVSPLVRFCK